MPARGRLKPTDSLFPSSSPQPGLSRPRTGTSRFQAKKHQLIGDLEKTSRLKPRRAVFDRGLECSIQPFRDRRGLRGIRLAAIGWRAARGWTVRTDHAPCGRGEPQFLESGLVRNRRRLAPLHLVRPPTARALRPAHCAPKILLPPVTISVSASALGPEDSSGRAFRCG